MLQVRNTAAVMSRPICPYAQPGPEASERRSHWHETNLLAACWF